MKAIQVENLSKSYLVGHNSAQAERYTALRDVLARNAKNLARKTRDMLTGRLIVQGDEIEEFWALKDITTRFNKGTGSASSAVMALANPPCSRSSAASPNPPEAA